MNEQKSQCQMLLEHLQEGKSITHLEAFVKYGIAHLPRRIKDLEERGYKINRETIEVEKANGKKAFVTRYTFSRDNFKQKEIIQPEFQFNY